MKGRVLVACEESQEVCKAFRSKSIEAYSCDILSCSGGHPEWHIMGDVMDVLEGTCLFKTSDGVEHVQLGSWDMIVAFPPCTYVTKASAVRMWVKGELQEERYRKALEAKEFFLRILNAPSDRIAIENPTPLKIVGLPPYTQVIQPYQYGHPYSKRTCLWLKGLPDLVPTHILDRYEPYINGGYKNKDGTYRKFQGRKERDPIVRSKTFPGVAAAMADQWGVLL